MVKNVSKVFSVFYRNTKQHHPWACGTIGSYTIATFLQNVLAPMYVSSILAIMATGGQNVLKQFYLLLAVVLVAQILYRMGDYFMVTFENRSMLALSQKAIEVIINQPYDFFVNNHSGALIAKMGRFTKSFEGMFDSLAYTFLFSVVQVVGIGYVLFSRSLLLGSIFLAWAMLYVVISIFMAKKRVPIDSKEAEMSSELTATSADIIGNAIMVLMFGQRKNEIAHFKECSTLYAKAQRRSWIYSNFQNGLQGLLSVLLELGSLAVAIVLWQKNNMTAAEVALVYLYMRIISNTMWEVGRTFVRFTKYNTDAQEMVAIFEKRPEVVEQLSEEQLQDGSVYIKDLTFGYGASKKVLSNVSLAISHGEHVGIVGSTGAGKSTLISMLTKFRAPDGGCIKIGGVDIAGMGHDALRKQIAIVPQDIGLLHRSVRVNIAYGKDDATLDEIIAVAKKAHIHEDIMALKNGYDTVLGERGMKLSGGQRQRIAIARALLIDAKLIILDEATSSLDPVTETYIQEILQKELVGRTVIIIAHRLATIRHCDRIIVLDNGSIKEDGSHQELMNLDEGMYAKFIKHQFA